jgi:hypothetical protein
MINPDDLEKMMTIVNAAMVFFVSTFAIKIGVDFWLSAL